MEEARRRAWECAIVLMGEYQDRLAPRAYGICRSALRQAPEALSGMRAKRLHGIYTQLVEARR